MLNQESDVPLKLSEHLNSVEWFDNSRLEVILACKRKAFWNLVGPPMLTGRPTDVGFQPTGLALSVGAGADFGTCAHAAHAAYRHTWQRMSEPDRRIMAYAEFEFEWLRLFPNGAQLSQHRLERGIQIMQAYFQRFEHEQALFKPIDPEVGFAIQITPRDDEPEFEPFWFAGRIDGVDERLSVGDLVVDELKTTGSGAARRLKSLGRSRQCKGYVWASREILKAEGLDPKRITGFLGDVILVAAKSTDFQRDYFPISQNELEIWRRETINVVMEWRSRLSAYVGKPYYAGESVYITSEWPFVDWPALFFQTTEECHKYGQCPFWDLCEFGPTGGIVQQYTLNTWNPALEAESRAERDTGAKTLTLVEDHYNG